MATHSSILAWRIPWTEEPGGLQSVGSQSDMTEQPTQVQTENTLNYLNKTDISHILKLRKRTQEVTGNHWK